MMLIIIIITIIIVIRIVSIAISPQVFPVAGATRPWVRRFAPLAAMAAPFTPPLGSWSSAGPEVRSPDRVDRVLGRPGEVGRHALLIPWDLACAAERSPGGTRSGTPQEIRRPRDHSPLNWGGWVAPSTAAERAAGYRRPGWGSVVVDPYVIRAHWEFLLWETHQHLSGNRPPRVDPRRG